ncbi:hypothetical protein Lal_00043187 [Lupinus albus]|nr:hypothetical protein Lal_00043187 [Lupinus albus]
MVSHILKIDLTYPKQVREEEEELETRVALDKSFARGELTNKVLRCLDRKWQPKVTAIVESKDLDSMPLATLFGKLQEHEMELGRLTMHEDSDRKKKNITLKATTSKSKEEKDDDESDSDLDDETMNLLVRKFSKFIKRKGGFKKFQKKEAKESTNKGKNNKDHFTCHECGKAGHMRFQCPTYLKKVDSEKSTPREFKSKKAYIVWDVPEEETTSSTSSEEESTKLCLMVRSDNKDNNEVYSDTSSTSDDLPSYDVLYIAYVELHEELKKLARINIYKKREILRNEKKLSQLQKELDELKFENETLDLIYSCNTCNCSAYNLCQKPVCETCEILQEDNFKLKEKLERLTNSKQQLDTLLSQTRNVGDRTGLGYIRSAKNKRPYRKPYQSWKSRLSERFLPERERITWEGEFLNYTGGFSPEQELSRLGEN